MGGLAGGSRTRGQGKGVDMSYLSESASYEVNFVNKIQESLREIIDIEAQLAFEANEGKIIHYKDYLRFANKDATIKGLVRRRESAIAELQRARRDYLDAVSPPASLRMIPNPRVVGWPRA